MTVAASGNTLDRRAFLSTAAAGLAMSGLQARGAPNTPAAISVDMFGARPDGRDATPGVRAAIERLPRQGGAILRFPPGTYRFRLDSGIAMNFANIGDLSVEGAGSIFLFQGNVRPLVFQNCPNLALSGIGIDWARPPFSQGQVAVIQGDRLNIDIRVDPEFPIDGSEVFWSILTYDRESRQMAIGGIDAGDIVASSKMVAPQTVRLVLKRPLPLRSGDTVVLRHRLDGGSHALSLFNCERPRLSGVRVHAAPGLALFGMKCRDVSIDNLSVMPAPNSGRLMSTNADAVHLANCSGRVDVQDSVMTGMGDDCINVLSGYATIVDRQGARVLHIEKRNRSNMTADDLPAAGDRIEIAGAGSLALQGQDSVAAAQPGATATLSFTTDLPPGLSPGDLVYDLTSQATLTVANCRFPGNRARGVLAHGGATIENCAFANQFEQAILLAPDMNWMEGGAADHVRIVGNTFHGAVRGQHRGQAAITVDAILPGHRPSDAIVNHDILIQSNLIADSSGGGIAANAVEGLRIENNRVERLSGPAIVLRTVRRAQISGNTCSPAAAIVIAPESEGQVTLERNTGLNL